jgi:hypothetical protein
MGDAPFTGPLERALRIKAYADGIRQRKELHELEKQKFMADLEDRKRQREMQDFSTQMWLDEIEANEVGPADEQGEAVLDSALGPVTKESKRRATNVPGAGRYWMPSQQDKSARATREAERAGRIEATKESTKKRILEKEDRESGRLIKIKIPAFGDQPETDAWVSADKYVDHLKTFRAMKRGKITNVRILTDKQKGTTTLVGIDADTGEPFEQKLETQLTPTPPRQSQTRNKPQFYYEGQARKELQKQLGITDPSAWVDNPRFLEAVTAEMEADKAAAASGGYDPSSEAEIRRRVMKKQKLAPKIRAVDAITPDMIKQKAAEIYDRESSGNAAPKSAGAARKTAAPSANRQKQMSADEIEYQKLYPKLSPADRKALEDAYQRDHGRPPRKPSMSPTGQAAPAPTDGDGMQMVNASFQDNPDPGFYRNPEGYSANDPGFFSNNASKQYDGFEANDPGFYHNNASMKPKQGSGYPRVNGRHWEYNVTLPERTTERDFILMKKGVRDGGYFKRQFLQSAAGWDEESFKRWEKKHPNQKLPAIRFESGRIDPKTHRVVLRVPVALMNVLRRFASPEYKQPVA